MTATCSIIEMEAAINYWRARSPSSGEELALCPQAAALAQTYARMIIQHLDSVHVTEMSPAARQALADWRAA